MARKVVENPKYAKPLEVDQATFAFPAKVIGELLPETHEIPEEFDDMSPTLGRPWVNLAHGIFFGSFKEMWYSEKPGIDLVAAQRHLSAVLRSFQPKHEHKIAGVAYLMSLWFTAVATSDGSTVRLWTDAGTEDMPRDAFMESVKRG